MAEENQLRAGNESANDAVRSLALSTAELWHEVLERLTRIEERQDALYQAISELKEGISAWQAEAIAQAEQRVDELQRAVMSELRGAVAGALGTGPEGNLEGSEIETPGTKEVVATTGRPSMPPAVEPDPLFAVPPLMTPESDTATTPEMELTPSANASEGETTTEQRPTKTERGWFSKRKARAQRSKEEVAQRSTLPPPAELTPDQISAILDAEFGPGTSSILPGQSPTPFTEPAWSTTEPEPQASALPEPPTDSVHTGVTGADLTGQGEPREYEPIQDAVLQALLGGASTTSSAPEPSPPTGPPPPPNPPAPPPPNPPTDWGIFTAEPNPSPQVEEPTYALDPDLDPDNVLGEIPAYPDSTSSTDRSSNSAQSLSSTQKPSPTREQISSWQTVLSQAQQQVPNDIQTSSGGDSLRTTQTETPRSPLAANELEEKGPPQPPPITPDFFATHKKHRFSRRK